MFTFRVSPQVTPTMKTLTVSQMHYNDKYGPWAVVTGASSGIGRALAVELAHGGMNLILVARTLSSLDALASELRLSTGVACQVVALDLADPAAVESLVTISHTHDVGLLVAAAGFGSSGAFLDNPLAPELEMLQVNCSAPLALSWYFGRRFAKRGRGGIILLSSIVAFQGTPYASHYAATKAYIQALAESLKVELQLRGVDVLAAAPGPTRTGFAVRARMNLGNAQEPTAIARPILNALGRRSTVLPGFLPKLLVYSLVLLPRWVRVRIMGRVMAGMAQTPAPSV
jgi:uncharacterized protein